MGPLCIEDGVEIKNNLAMAQILNTCFTLVFKKDEDIIKVAKWEQVYSVAITTPEMEAKLTWFVMTKSECQNNCHLRIVKELVHSLLTGLFSESINFGVVPYG